MFPQSWSGKRKGRERRNNPIAAGCRRHAQDRWWALMDGDGLERGARVIPGVQLLRVEQDGPVVRADVFGGNEPAVVGEVEFRIDDPTEYRRVVQTFRAWEGNANMLTLVQGEDGVVTLVDEGEAFNSAVND